MDRIRVKCLPDLHVIVAISSVLIVIASIAAAMDFNFQIAQGQNATTTTNQTGSVMPNQTATNQSTAAPASAPSPFGNLTQADFQGVKDQLSTARDAIHDNDGETAYDALNSADSELFGKTN